MEILLVQEQVSNLHCLIPRVSIITKHPGGESIWGKPFADEFKPNLVHKGTIVHMCVCRKNVLGINLFVVCVFVHVCVCAWCIYVCVRACVYVHVWYVHVCVHAHMQTHAHVYACACLVPDPSTHANTCTCICMCAYPSMCILTL